MKKQHILAQVGLILIAIVSLSGCNRTIEATAHCQLSSYQSDLGSLNVGNFSLGEIAMVDHGSQRIYRVYGIEPNAADLKYSDGTGTQTAPVFSRFAISTDSEVDPERMKGLQSLIDSNITIHLGAYRKTEVVPVYDLINRDPRINIDMENVLKTRKDVDFILISGLIASDNAKVTLKDSSGTDPLVRTLKAPGYALTVHLDFAKALQEDEDMKAGQFFNYIPVTIDPTSHRLVTVQNKKLDVLRYEQVPSKMYMAPGSKQP